MAAPRLKGWFAEGQRHLSMGCRPDPARAVRRCRPNCVSSGRATYRASRTLLRPTALAVGCAGGEARPPPVPIESGKAFCCSRDVFPLSQLGLLTVEPFYRLHPGLLLRHECHAAFDLAATVALPSVMLVSRNKHCVVLFDLDHLHV